MPARYLIAFLLSVFAGVLPVCAAEEPLRVGIILPLSGASASLGGYINKGIDLAYTELPEAVQQKIQLFYEDDGWQMSRAVSAFQKLSTSNKIDVAIVSASSIGNAVAPLAEQQRIPLIAIGASDAKVAAGRKFAFIHWVTPEIEARSMANELKRRGYQRIAIIGSEQEGVYAVMKALKNEMASQQMSGRVVLEENFIVGETDFRTYIAKAHKTGVDAVIVCLLPGSLASFAKQARHLGITADLAGIELFEDENEVKASEGALVGQWYVSAAPASSSFQTAYRNKYNEQAGWAAANGYDVIKLIAEAYAQAGNDREKIAAYLSSLKDYSGACGTYSATGDKRFSLPATIKVVTETGFEDLKPSSATSRLAD